MGYLALQIKTCAIRNSVLNIQSRRKDRQKNKQNFKCHRKHARPSQQHCLISRDFLIEKAITNITGNVRYHRFQITVGNRKDLSQCVL